MSSQLPPEYELKLRNLECEIIQMPTEEVKANLMALYKEMLYKEATYKAQLKQQWNINKR